MTSPQRLYLDSSALIKLYVREKESAPLREFLNADNRVRCTSVITEIEALRVLRPQGRSTLEIAREDFTAFYRVLLTDDVVRVAAELPPAVLRALDAIHIASALQAGAELLLTYDRRMGEAAQAVGLPVHAPGWTELQP
jgi:predicted nucleic acid-binding protein